jgi:hypothetical protein
MFSNEDFYEDCEKLIPFSIPGIRDNTFVALLEPNNIGRWTFPVLSPPMWYSVVIITQMDIKQFIS